MTVRYRGREVLCPECGHELRFGVAGSDVTVDGAVIIDEGQPVVVCKCAGCPYFAKVGLPASPEVTTYAETRGGPQP